MELSGRLLSFLSSVMFVGATFFGTQVLAGNPQARVDVLEKSDFDIRELVSDIRQAEEIEAINNGRIDFLFASGKTSTILGNAALPSQNPPNRQAAEKKSAKPSRILTKKGRVAVR